MLDFNDVPVNEYVLIPANTKAQVHLEIKRGNYNYPEKGWSEGIVTRNPKTGACYLDCVFTVLSSDFAGRKFFSNIGLHSEKGPRYENMGKHTMKAILDSQYALLPDDTSEEAKAKRQIADFAALEQIPFAVVIDVETNTTNGIPKNVLQKVITPDIPAYQEIMSDSTPDNNMPF